MLVVVVICMHTRQSGQLSYEVTEALVFSPIRWKGKKAKRKREKKHIQNIDL